MWSGKTTGSQTNMPDMRPQLRPPGTRPATSMPEKTVYRWVWVALAAVILLVLLVVLVLPQLVTGPSVSALQENTREEIKPPPTVGDDAQDRRAARTQAEQALQKFLHLQAKLELVNAGKWGEPEWSQAAGRAASGDRFFGERRFEESMQDYRAGLRMLEELESSRPQRFAETISAGQKALENDDGDAAQELFELALVIEPGDEQTLQALARARVRADVLLLMESGSQAEGQNDLETARTRYSEALQLDKDYQPAAAHLMRVEQQIKELAFSAAMSNALVALDAGKLTDAAEALEAADQIKPGDEAVRDSRQRLVRLSQQARLSRLRRDASARSRVEDWQAAVNLYNKALSVDANAGFAREGLKHAQDRLRLNRQLDHYLSDPARLYSQEPLSNAEQLLSSAGSAPDSEPKLAAKISRLKRHVAEARLPLTVNLHSDGETEVVIYHVGRLGSFVDHKLQLRPGTYTAVGSRPGYRDVRRVFTLSPGQPSASIEIRCEEPV